jgi:hypothetical protein
MPWPHPRAQCGVDASRIRRGAEERSRGFDLPPNGVNLLARVRNRRPLCAGAQAVTQPALRCVRLFPYLSSSLIVINGLATNKPSSVPLLGHGNSPWFAQSGIKFDPTSGVNLLAGFSGLSAPTRPLYRHLTNPPAINTKNSASTKSRMPLMLVGSDPLIEPYAILIGGSGTTSHGSLVHLTLAIKTAVTSPTCSSLTLFISLNRVTCNVTSDITWSLSAVNVSTPESNAAVVLTSSLVLALAVLVASESRSAAASAAMMILVILRMAPLGWRCWPSMGFGHNRGARVGMRIAHGGFPLFCCRVQGTRVRGTTSGGRAGGVAHLRP